MTAVNFDEAGKAFEKVQEPAQLVPRCH